MPARVSIRPGDVPPRAAARRIGLTLNEFEKVKHALFDRKFPQPDETTGNYDLDAIDRWRHARHPHLFPELGLTGPPRAADSREVFSDRLAKLAGG